MSAPEPAGRVPLEALLEHREWVRALARTLVADPHRADDIEQETWRHAIERPPRHAGSLRAWFARVVRSTAAGMGRRDAARARLASGAAAAAATSAERGVVPSPDDIVAEAELQTRLVRAVLELGEPYASTVLYRWFRDLPPSEIAARTGVPVETVKTRLKRAVAMLRERMDREIGGDGPRGRRAWGLLAGGVLPAAGDGSAGTSTALADVMRGGLRGVRASHAATVTGGLLMSVGKTLAAAVVVLAVALGVWLVVSDGTGTGANERSSAADSEDTQRSAPGASADTASSAAPRGRARSDRADTDSAAGPDAIGSEDGAPGKADGAGFGVDVVDAATQRPVSGATVTFHADRAADEVLRRAQPDIWFDTGPVLSRGVTGTDGSVRAAAGTLSGGIARISADGYVPTAQHVAPWTSRSLRRIELVPATLCDVRVVASEDQQPISGATLHVFARGAPSIPCMTATTGPDGIARLPLAAAAVPRMVPLGGLRVVVTAPGRALADHRGDWLPLPVMLAQGTRVAGRVVDDAGVAVPDAVIVAEHPSSPRRAARTAADGTWSIDGFPPSWAGSVELVATARGKFTRRLPAAVGDESVRIVLGRPSELRGVVFDPEGRPCPAADVRAEIRGVGALDAATTGPDGRFVLRVPGDARTIVVRAALGRIRDESFDLDVPAASAEATVTLSPAAPDATAGGAESPSTAASSPAPGDAAAAGSFPEIALFLVAADVSFARLAATDEGGASMTVADFHSAAVLSSFGADESPVRRLAFSVPPGTTVRGRVAVWCDDGATTPPEFPAEIVTSGRKDAPPVSLQVPSTVVARFRALGPDGRELPADVGVTVVVEALHPGGVQVLGSGPRAIPWRLSPTGRYRVATRAAGLCAAPREFTGDDAARGPIDIPLAPAPTLRGVVFGPDGRPLAGAWVMAGVGGGSVGADGRFAFPVGEPGRVRAAVTWWGVGGAVWTGEFDVVPGTVTEAGEIRIEAPCEVRGVVVDERGDAAGGATVSWADGADIAQMLVQTDATGAFTARVARNSRGAFVASRPRSGPAWTEVAAATVHAASPAPLRVTLRRPCRVRVRIPVLAGNVSTIAVRVPGTPILWYPPRAVVGSETAETSVYELDDLPAGRWTVVASAAPTPVSGEVEATPDEDAEAVLR